MTAPVLITIFFIVNSSLHRLNLADLEYLQWWTMKMGAISRFITSKSPTTCLPLFTHKQYKYCVVYTKGAFKSYVWANHYGHRNNISQCEINIVINQVEA